MGSLLHNAKEHGQILSSIMKKNTVTERNSGKELEREDNAE